MPIPSPHSASYGKGGTKDSGFLANDVKKTNRGGTQRGDHVR
jgi:hypothetical protein